MQKRELLRLRETGGSGGVGVFAGVVGKRLRTVAGGPAVPLGVRHQAAVPKEPCFSSEERGDQLVEVHVERVVVPFVVAASFVHNVKGVPAPRCDAAPPSDTELASDDDVILLKP